MAVSLAIVVNGQIRKVPASVTEAFKEKYPNATNVEWKDKVTSFAASFEEEGKQYEAKFNSKGEWQETEEMINEEEMPETVKEGLEKSKYSEWEIIKVRRIELPGDVVQFKVQVEKSEIQKKNLLFSSEGKLLKDNITI
jgi:hypothetical protein